MESKLKELYQDPEIGLSSKNNFFNKAKQYIPNLLNSKIANPAYIGLFNSIHLGIN